MILAYVYEYADHEYNVEFFQGFDQVARKYTRVRKYGEDTGVRYGKERFPLDKNLDGREKTKLIHFSNLLKVALHLIPNIKKGKRTHIVQLCARICEGNDNEPNKLMVSAK